MISHEMLLEDALKLRPVEMTNLTEGLMASLEKPDSEIESLWEQEALKRYEAYKQSVQKRKIWKKY